MKQNADLYSRSHQAAVDILKDLELISIFVGDSVKELELQIELLATTQEFARDTQVDVAEAISRLKELPVNLTPILQQLPEDLEIISRGLNESAGLAKQTRGRLDSAGEYLYDTKERAQGQINMTANLETIERGKEYWFTSEQALRRVFRLAGLKYIRFLLEKMERGE